MSASQDKKQQQLEASDQISKKEAARKSAIRAKRKKRVIGIVIGILVVLLLAAIIIINSNLFYTILPAVSIGNTDYTTAEYNYYYQTAYMSFENTYGSYFSSMLDPDQPLDEQQYDDEMTWDDFFSNSAIENLRRITMLCDMAEADGFTMSQEAQDNIDSVIEDFETSATDYGYANVNAMISANYGQGTTLDLVREQMTKTALATEYSDHILNSFSYTEDELETYYQENRDSLDYISYSFVYVDGTADEANGVDQETAMSTAKALAQQIVATAGDQDSFEKNVSAYAGREAVTASDFASSVSSYGFGSWLLEPDRQVNDTAVIEVADSGYYAVIFLGRDDNHYNMANIRQILITAELLEDGGITQENVDIAHEKAEELLEEWKSGEATEESFAALAEENSEDSASNTNGGLCENVIKQQLSDQFDEFCFNPDRQYGDTDIVFVETDTYVGYLILYYLDEGDLYSNHLADLDLREQDYATWEEDQLTNYEATTHFALHFGK